MFIRKIPETSLVSNAANSIFGNITGDQFDEDYSFLSTMRAILPNRMVNGDSVQLSFRSSSYNIEQLMDVNIEAAVNAVFRSNVELSSGNQIVIQSLNNSDSENNSAVLKFISENIDKVFNGYNKIEDLSLFMNKVAKADFYINENARNTVVIIDNTNTKTLHMLQSLLPRLLPWFFTEPINDEEKAILFALTKTNANEYMYLIENIAKKYDFRTVRIQTLLSGFENVFERRELDSLTKSLNDINVRIRDLEFRYSERLKEKENIIIRQLGLRQRMGEKSESEIMEYFLCNKALFLQNVLGTELTFVSEAYLDNYDPEIFERIISNKKSVFYEVLNSKFETTHVEILLRGIFGEDAPLKIKTCAAYRIDLGEMSVLGLREYTFPVEFENHLPNQHIQKYSCLGNNEQYIRKCLQEHNYISAIEQCISSARNFNMADVTVALEFMREIFSPRAKQFIEMPDGTSCTPLKALQWLKEQNVMEVKNNEQTD